MRCISWPRLCEIFKRANSCLISLFGYTNKNMSTVENVSYTYLVQYACFAVLYEFLNTLFVSVEFIVQSKIKTV